MIDLLCKADGRGDFLKKWSTIVDEGLADCMIPHVSQSAGPSLPPEGLGMRLCRYRAFFLRWLPTLGRASVERTRPLAASACIAGALAAPQRCALVSWGPRGHGGRGAV